MSSPRTIFVRIGLRKHASSITEKMNFIMLQVSHAAIFNKIPGSLDLMSEAYKSKRWYIEQKKEEINGKWRTSQDWWWIW